METPHPSIADPPPRLDYQSHHVPTHFAPRTALKLTVGIVLLMAGLAAGFFLMHRHRENMAAALNAESASVARPPAVEVVTTKYASDTEPLTFPGETAGWYETTIYSRVNGYVANWIADIGDRVKKGAILAEIETPELDAQLAAAQAKLTAADAEVKVGEAGVALSKSTYERWWQSPKGVVSEQERQEKKAEFDSSIAKLNAASSQVQIAQADVNSLTAQTAFKKVRAPFDGVVTSRKIDLGDLVTAGSTASTHYLYGLAQSDKIRVFVDVPQAISFEVKNAMPAVVRAGEFTNREFVGHVARTANAIDPASRTLRVEVDVANPDLALMPGMYVQLSFELVRESLLQVPASALLFRAKGAQVAVVNGDGKVHFQAVTIARDNGDTVEIASGISPNTRVALNLPSRVNDGDIVTADDSLQQSPPPAPTSSAPLTH